MLRIIRSQSADHPSAPTELDLKPHGNGRSTTISKQFDDVRAVDGIDLTAGEGEFLVLLGPSGCGKTTLMRMIAGLERPTPGDIVIDGKVVTDLPPRARNIAMVFQSYALYPHLTVEKNISFPLRAVGMPKAKSARRSTGRRACSASNAFSTASRASFPAASASGSRLRARWCASRSVFLLDEPLSNLDAKLRNSRATSSSNSSAASAPRRST